MNRVSGINEVGIDRLILDISEYARQISKNLNCIEELVEGTSGFLKGEIGMLYRKQFENIRASFATINSNILSYNRDLSHVKQGYKVFIENAVSDFNRNNKYKKGGKYVK